MAVPVRTKPGWRFGVFEVDARKGELRRSGLPLKLREQSFRTLLALLENPGEIVTRDELRHLLWPSDTFVDFDHSLNTAMMKLRDALGDSTEAPIYIETIPKRGYRFIAPVSLISDRNISLALAGSDRSSGQRMPPIVSHGGLRSHPGMLGLGMLGLAIAVVVGALIALGVWMLRSRSFSVRKAGEAVSHYQLVPITTAPGWARDPAISPDGRTIAYVWDDPENRRPDLFVILIGNERALRVTYSNRGVVGHPAWSPDGREIAFTRCEGSRGGVYVVPALGGDERILARVECYWDGPNTVAWSSDAAKLFFTDRCAPGDNDFGLVSFSLSTGEKKCLSQTGAHGYFNRYRFALSPDSKTIAFLPAVSSKTCAIYTVAAAGGKPHQIVEEDKPCTALMWDPDGKFVLFLSERTRLPSMWRVSVHGGEIRPETKYPHIGSFSKDGKRFVFSEETSNEPHAIWRADLIRPGGPVLRNWKVVSSQYLEEDAQPSPDGLRIVWASSRTGFFEIWAGDASGQNQRQITNVSGYAGTPRWSADGNWIVFDRHLDDGTQIFTIDREGRNLRQITSRGTPNIVPSWSHDGKAIYFTSKRTGMLEVWKRVLETGTEEKLTLHGGFDPVESPDGKFVYFSKFEEPGLWKLPSNGGEETQILKDEPPVSYWGHWAPIDSGIYVLNLEAESGPRIDFHDLTTGIVTNAFAFQGRPAVGQGSLSATADGKTIYYTQWDRQGVIKMMEFSR